MRPTFAFPIAESYGFGLFPDRLWGGLGLPGRALEGFPGLLGIPLELMSYVIYMDTGVKIHGSLCFLVAPIVFCFLF